MSDSHTTATPETTNAAPTAHPPVRENQRAIEAEVEQGAIAGQWVMGRIGGGSPETPPEKFAGTLAGMEGRSQTGMLRQLQRSYGNSYVGSVIQRKADGNGTCADCEKKEREIQRKGEGEVSAVPDGFEATMQRSGTGQSLDEGTRSFMESGFGQDFGDVKVHTDGAAAEAAKQIQAQAFTTRRDIYFGRGHYQPQMSAGRKLLAHELTHVVQQKSQSLPKSQPSLEVGHPLDASECEADNLADRIVGGEQVNVKEFPRASISRQPQPTQQPPTVPSPSQQPASLETRVNNFKQFIGNLAKNRLYNNSRALDAWMTFLETKLTPQQVQAQVNALEASVLYRNISHAQSHGGGNREADLYELWTHTPNPLMRTVLAQQIQGRWRACTGCHMTTYAHNYGLTHSPVGLEWDTPVDRLRRGALQGGGRSPFPGGGKGMELGSTAAAGYLNPSAATTPSTPTTSGTVPAPGGVMPGVSQYFGVGFDTSQRPDTASVMNSVTQIRPFLDMLGPNGYKVLPPETLASQATPVQLVAQIRDNIEGRKAAYQELVRRINSGEADIMQFQAIVNAVLPLAAEDVRQELENERKRSETIDLVIAGIAIVLLFIAIAFPPTTILALGVTAGEVTAVGGTIVAVHGLSRGWETLQQGIDLELGQGANDVFYPEQQRSADATVFAGLMQIVLSALAIKGAISSVPTAIQQGNLVRTLQSLRNAQWSGTLSGNVLIATNDLNPSLIFMIDSRGAGLYRILPDGRMVTVTLRPLSIVTEAATTTSSSTGLIQSGTTGQLSQVFASGEQSTVSIILLDSTKMPTLAAGKTPLLSASEATTTPSNGQLILPGFENMVNPVPATQPILKPSLPEDLSNSIDALIPVVEGSPTMLPRQLAFYDWRPPRISTVKWNQFLRGLYTFQPPVGGGTVKMGELLFTYDAQGKLTQVMTNRMMLGTRVPYFAQNYPQKIPGFDYGHLGGVSEFGINDWLAQSHGGFPMERAFNRTGAWAIAEGRSGIAVSQLAEQGKPFLKVAQARGFVNGVPSEVRIYVESAGNIVYDSGWMNAPLPPGINVKP